MSEFEAELKSELAEIEAQGLRRVLRRVNAPQEPVMEIEGRRVLNFCSNDYLGLANDPAIRNAAAQALERFGAGSGASRLICGSLAPHHELEERLAAFKGTEAALTFSSGYATAVGTIPALVGPDDIVVIDRLAHACIVDAARLSRARLRVFTHNDLDHLENILAWADKQRSTGTAKSGGRIRKRVLVVTESVFSMDGDLAPLKGIVDLKDRYGAWLMVDEAHATGVFGEGGRGAAHAAGVAHRIEVHMGTLGKALGAAGGFIAGSRALIDLLINRARSLIFSTAPPPATAAAAAAAVELVQSEAGDVRRRQLSERVEQLQRTLPEGPWLKPKVQGPIVPLVVGDEQVALTFANRLWERGIYIPAIRYPTVGRGRARLRLTLSAAHSPAHLEALTEALQAVTQTPLDGTAQS